MPLAHYLTRLRSRRSGPVHSQGTTSGKQAAAGWVQVSVELLPTDVAELHPAGAGRAEPNDLPTLPPPTGRFRWSLNPLANCYNVLGPALCAKLGCAACLVASAALGAVILVQMIPVIAANLVTDILLG